MSNFGRLYVNGGVVIIVNLNRATIQEAKELISILEEERSSRDKKLVVDLGQCEFVDPTFIGILLVTLKRLKAQGKSLKLVKPDIPQNDSSVVTNILRLFEVYKSREEALASFAS
jgi:anti-anti-sigma factor